MIAPGRDELSRLERIEAACAELWATEPAVDIRERAVLYARVAEVEGRLAVLRLRAEADHLDDDDRRDLDDSESWVADLHLRWSGDGERAA